MSPEQGPDSEREERDDSNERADRERREDDLDEQEDESFPASDPHSDWAGPASEGE